MSLALATGLSAACQKQTDRAKSQVLNKLAEIKNTVISPTQVRPCPAPHVGDTRAANRSKPLSRQATLGQ